MRFKINPYTFSTGIRSFIKFAWLPETGDQEIIWLEKVVVYQKRIDGYWVTVRVVPADPK